MARDETNSVLYDLEIESSQFSLDLLQIENELNSFVSGIDNSETANVCIFTRKFGMESKFHLISTLYKCSYL